MSEVRIGYWLSSEEHDPRALVAHAGAAERAGVRTAMISDHLRPWVPQQGHAAYAWTVVGGIAATTDVLEVGTGVTAMVQRQHPIAVAHALATATVMLEGRCFLGVGTGERLNEQAFGARWPRPPERRAQLAAAVKLVRRLCAGETVSAHGDWIVERLELATRPAVTPPVLVAATGPASARLAGEVGDGLVATAPDATLVSAFHGSGGAGKRCVGQLHVCLGPSLDEARATAWDWWPNAVVPNEVLTELADPAEFAAVARAIGPSTMTDGVVCATDATPVVAAIDRFVGAGYDTVYLHQVGPDQTRLLDVVGHELLAHYGS
jgi:G6PDH family F420-dependent oxidoreductase